MASTAGTVVAEMTAFSNCSSVVARKFSDRGGTAYLLEHEGTVILAAGNVAPDQIELMIRTLERR